MEKKPDVVLLYGPTWDAPSQMSKHHLAKYWARSRRVLYVESPLNPVSFITRKEEARRLWHRYTRGPVQVSERLWIQGAFNLLPYRGRSIGLGGRWVNSFNQAIASSNLRGILRSLDFNNPILFIGNAQALPLVDRIEHCLLAYHCSDDYTLVPNFPESFPALEVDLFNRCDVVIATAEELRNAKKHLNPNVVTVTNGADVRHFSRTQEPSTIIPDDISRLSRPIIGYIGSIFVWIDQNMVVHAARKHPDWNFVFIGPMGVDTKVLEECRNIHIIGPRPYDTLPGYLKGFDATIVPFAQNDVTLRASPIKFYEYLASGIPVVATRLPDFEPYSHVSRLVNTYEEFEKALVFSLGDNTSEKKELRMKEARKNSWDSRFEHIDRVLDEALQKKIAVQKDSL